MVREVDYLMLNQKECEELSQYTADFRKQQFLTSRRLLKYLLSNHEVSFLKKKNGQPMIEDMNYNLFSSLSYSQSHAIVLVSEKPIGVDLEPINRQTSELLRKRLLTEREAVIARYLTTLEIWCIKEAVLKLLGTGIKAGLQSVEIIKPSKTGASVNTDRGLVMVYMDSIDNHIFAVAYFDE